MRNRTNSQQTLEKLPINTSIGPNLANLAPQNYLHNLKQSKAPKTTTAATKKPEALSSLLKSANIRPLSSRNGAGVHNPYKPESSIQINSARAQDSKSHQLPIDRSCNPRLPKVSEAKPNLFARNNSEPRLNANNHVVLKHVMINIQDPPATTDDPQQNNQGCEEKILQTQETEGQAEKCNSVSGVEFMTTGTSSNDKTQGQVLNSASVVSNLDSQESSRKPEEFVSKKTSQAIDILYDSFENNKDFAAGSEENDSKLTEECMNHPNKKAKYYTIYEDDPSLQYHLCSKCAVALADKGTKIRKIIASEEELRKSEIEAFLIKLSHSRKSTEKVNDSICLKRRDFEQFFTKQTEKAEAIASVLEKMIKQELNHVKKCLDSQRSQLFEAIDSIEKQLNANLQEISDMQSDIERNLENILKNIELKPFQKIIGAYHERVQDLDQQVEMIRSQKIAVEKLPKYQSKQLQELKASIQALFARTEHQTSFLKKNEAENNQGDTSKTKNSNNISSLCASFENRDILEGAYDPIFESHQRPERFTFANEKFVLKTLKQGDGAKAVTPKHQEMEVLNRALQNVVLNRSSQGSTNEVNTQRSTGNARGKGDRKGYFNQNTEVKAIEKYLSLLEKVNTSQTKKKRDDSSPFQSSRYHEDWEKEEDDDEANSLRYAALNDSVVCLNSQDCDFFPSSKNLDADYSSRRHCGSKNEKRQVQSQNSSFNFAEDELIFPRIISDQHKSAYCSPNFKENID